MTLTFHYLILNLAFVRDHQNNTKNPLPELYKGYSRKSTRFAAQQKATKCSSLSLLKTCPCQNRLISNARNRPVKEGNMSPNPISFAFLQFKSSTPHAHPLPYNVFPSLASNGSRCGSSKVNLLDLDGGGSSLNGNFSSSVVSDSECESGLVSPRVERRRPWSCSCSG